MRFLLVLSQHFIALARSIIAAVNPPLKEWRIVQGDLATRRCRFIGVEVSNRGSYWSHPSDSNRRPADYELGIPQPHLRLDAAGLARRRVQGVGEALVAGGQPMRVPAQGGAGIGVTELRADIGDGMAFGQMQRRKGVAQVVGGVPGQPGALENFGKHPARPVFVDKLSPAA